MSWPFPIMPMHPEPTPLGNNPTSIPHAGKIFELLDRWTPEQRAEVFYGLEHHWCWHCGHPQADPVHAECGAPSERDRRQGDRMKIERALVIAILVLLVVYLAGLVG